MEKENSLVTSFTPMITLRADDDDDIRALLYYGNGNKPFSFSSSTNTHTHTHMYKCIFSILIAFLARS